MASFLGIVRKVTGTPKKEPIEKIDNKWQKSPKDDLTGRKYGRLTVVSYFRATIRPTGRWKCLCDCGKETIVSTVRLKQGRIKTCGTCPKKIADLEGKTYGLLKVVDRVPNKIISGKTVVQWKCICQCGNVNFVPTAALTNGHTKSCGCLPLTPKSVNRPINILIRRLNLNKIWKSQVLFRDQGKCRLCNKPANHAHHIKFLSEIISDNNIKTVAEAKACKELWDLDNGLSLCVRCHILLHQNSIRKEN